MCRIFKAKSNQVYIRKPGPKEYSSHFSGLFYSSCLVFQTTQFFLLITGRTGTFRNKWYLRFSLFYWISTSLSGFICGIAFTFTPKPDVVAIEFLVFFSALTAVMYLIFTKQSQPREALVNRQDLHEAMIIQSSSNEHSTTIPGDHQHIAKFDSSQRGEPRWPQRGRRCSRLCLRICKIFNRFLKVVHWGFSVLFIAGAIVLALSYRFSNP